MTELRWRYVKADGLATRIEQLLRIFRQLLMVLDGDVENALDHIDAIAERYDLFDEQLTSDDLRRMLLQRGEIRHGQDGLGLTTRGERALRRQALQDVFQGLTPKALGDHRVPHEGGVGEALEETRPWQVGDAYDTLDGTRSLTNWLRRTGGRGTLCEDDLEVRDRERATTCATVLLIDVSHSMTLYGEDRITPAKRVALALTELILTKYPKDTIDVVLFGDEATQVPLERLPYLSNGPFHTNTKAGLRMAQELLRRRKQVNKQIVMLTDGKPSAIDDEAGIYKNPFGLDERIVNRTLEEAISCRRRGIQVTTFMMTSDPSLKRFVEDFTEASRGRAYFADSTRLESFVLVDFLRNRRRRT